MGPGKDNRALVRTKVEIILKIENLPVFGSFSKLLLDVALLRTQVGLYIAHDEMALHSIFSTALVPQPLDRFRQKCLSAKN